jgi:hypothetical protein
MGNAPGTYNQLVDAQLNQEQATELGNDARCTIN